MFARGSYIFYGSPQIYNMGPGDKGPVFGRQALQTIGQRPSAPPAPVLTASQSSFSAVFHITCKRQEDDASGCECIASVFVAWKYALLHVLEDEGKNKDPLKS